MPILFKGKKGKLTTIERLEAIISSPSSFHGSKRPSPVEDVALLIDTHKFGAKLGQDEIWLEKLTRDYLFHEKGSFREKYTNHSLVENGVVASWTCNDVRTKKVNDGLPNNGLHSKRVIFLNPDKEIIDPVFPLSNKVIKNFLRQVI